MKKVTKRFREKIRTDWGYDDTHIEILEREFEKYQQDIKEAEPEFPDSVYKVGLYTYQTLGLLARAMLASIEGWDGNKKLQP